MNNRPGLSVGDRVYDRDKDSQTGMVIVDSHSEPACETPVPGTGKTVAAFNESYSPESQVVTAVFENDLNNKAEDWEALDVSDLQEQIQNLSLREYDYPEPRLIRQSAFLPDQIQTYHELICYQNARLIQLAAGIPDPAFLWKRYNQLKADEIEMASITKENKYQLREDLGVCIYCKAETETTFDHVIPLSRGGADDISNQVPACLSCNSSKSNSDVIQWCKKRNEPVPRIVWGKYLKQFKHQLENDGNLQDSVPDKERQKWDGVEIQRNITKRIRKRARDKNRN